MSCLVNIHSISAKLRKAPQDGKATAKDLASAPKIAAGMP